MQSIIVISIAKLEFFVDYLLYLRIKISFENMLNRRILRTKAFKAVYAFAENHGMTLKEAEGLLELSCESTRDLYLFLLSITGPLTAECRARLEAARGKFNPTEDELNPNMKFAENSIAPLLMDDPDFTRIISRKKLSWEPYDMLLRHLYESIRERKYFRDYLDSEETGPEADAALWAKIFEREFEDNAELHDILEEMSIYWNDDLGYALTWCCKTVRMLGKGGRWKLPPLYQSDMEGHEGFESDRSFIFSLLRAAYVNFDAFVDKVDALTPKWTRDRICTTDLALIVCGMAEAGLPGAAPVKVIINEYVEISKSYSTPESSGFVNGLLDKLINTHQETTN